MLGSIDDVEDVVSDVAASDVVRDNILSPRVAQDNILQHSASDTPEARRIERVRGTVVDDFEDNDEAIGEAVLTPSIVSKMEENDANLLQDDEDITAFD